MDTPGLLHTHSCMHVVYVHMQLYINVQSANCGNTAMHTHIQTGQEVHLMFRLIQAAREATEGPLPLALKEYARP